MSTGCGFEVNHEQCEYLRAQPRNSRYPATAHRSRQFHPAQTATALDQFLDQAQLR